MHHTIDNMDRITVRTQPIRSKSTSVAISGVPAFFGILLATTCGYSSISTLIVGMVVLACSIFIIWHLMCRGQLKLKEAVVEITPLGVQLLSIYGTSHDVEASTKSTSDRDRVKIRTFLPKQQILDVIVMEIVWPHCVWSQVAFRVAKGNKLNQNEVSNEPHYAESYNINHLLQQNRVEIIPCFPDEYRGVLTYEKCLEVQIKIEELLRLEKRRTMG